MEAILIALVQTTAKKYNKWFSETGKILTTKYWKISVSRLFETRRMLEPQYQSAYRIFINIRTQLLVMLSENSHANDTSQPELPITTGQTITSSRQCRYVGGNCIGKLLYKENKKH